MILPIIKKLILNQFILLYSMAYNQRKSKQQILIHCELCVTKSYFWFLRPLLVLLHYLSEEVSREPSLFMKLKFSNWNGPWALSEPGLHCSRKLVSVSGLHFAMWILIVLYISLVCSELKFFNCHSDVCTISLPSKDHWKWLL